jgi:hypothetical protein
VHAFFCSVSKAIFFTVKLIESYLRCTGSQEKLDGLEIIAVEGDLVHCFGTVQHKDKKTGSSL